MRYALTGDTGGFGRYIKARLLQDGHEVIGFSRTSGFDLNGSVDDVIRLSGECDVFINNACVGDAQIRLLLGFRTAYQHTDKSIISIGSWITEANVMDDMPEYAYEHHVKTSLRDLSYKLMRSDGLRIEYLTWGFHAGHPLLKRYPHLLDGTTIEEAVDQLVSRL